MMVGTSGKTANAEAKTRLEMAPMAGMGRGPPELSKEPRNMGFGGEMVELLQLGWD